MRLFYWRTAWLVDAWRGLLACSGATTALARIAKGVAVGIVLAPAMADRAPVVKIQQRLSGDAGMIRGVDRLFGVATKREAVNREFLKEN
jgi:hypothetical protein